MIGLSDPSLTPTADHQGESHEHETKLVGRMGSPSAGRSSGDGVAPGAGKGSRGRLLLRLLSPKICHSVWWAPSATPWCRARQAGQKSIVMMTPEPIRRLQEENSTHKSELRERSDWLSATRKSKRHFHNRHMRQQEVTTNVPCGDSGVPHEDAEVSQDSDVAEAARRECHHSHAAGHQQPRDGPLHGPLQPLEQRVQGHDHLLLAISHAAAGLQIILGGDPETRLTTLALEVQSRVPGETHFLKVADKGGDDDGLQNVVSARVRTREREGEIK